MQASFKHKLLTATGVALAFTIAASEALAAGNTLPETQPASTQELTTPSGERVTLDQAQTGSLLFKTDTFGEYISAPMVATDVKMNIAGPIIRTTLSQTFSNTSDQWVEGVYVFPLPEDAAVDHLRMVVGGRIIEGEIQEKKKAKAIYEQAKREGKKASLVEQERPNMFTASVANIGPGEKVAIQIEYQDMAEMKGGKFSLRFPMTVAPRFSPTPQTVQVASNGGTQTVAFDPVLDRKRITPPVMPPALEPVEYIRLPVSLSVNLDAGFDIETVKSPYHLIDTNKIDADSVSIKLSEGKVPANRDFKLEWEAAPSDRPYSAVFRQDIGEESFLLSMLTPSKPASTVMKTHARESIYIIDTSGSMGGTSIVQARKSLLLALDHLDAKDTFNIIRFSSEHDLLFSKAVFATQANLARARSYVKGLEADGGTNMAPALEAAFLDDNPEGGRVRQVVFITDGAIGNEKLLFAQIQDELKNSRLFPVAIGSAPNSFFMSRAAKFGRGTYVQIGNVDEVQSEMGNLFAALDNPVLTAMSSNLSGVGEAYPSRLPDLYEGDPILSVAKINAKDIPENFTLSGRLAGGDWGMVKSLGDIETAKGLSVLWARSKIADLEEQRFDRNTAARIDQEILETALDYHLVSRLTSLVAVDVTPTRPSQENFASKQVPTQLPEGWDFGSMAFSDAALATRHHGHRTPGSGSNSQRSIPLPNTASPHVMLTWLGLILMLISLLAVQRCGLKSLSRRQT